MNDFLNTMKQETNYGLTANGAVTHKSTLNEVLDLFAMGAAYREHSEDDCITLFKSAFERNESLALKCLFYLRDVRGGQGERRFFRVVTKWLANHETEAMLRNLRLVPEYGRWDDLYTFVDTPLEDAAFSLMYCQLALDVDCKTPSLLAKWLKSENTSSAESRYLAVKTCEAFDMTPRQYRKTLSTLRERIRIVERLMSQNRWEEIEFDKIPSRAGLIYRNAFARRDILKERYEKFAKDKDTTVNADALYPNDIAHKAFEMGRYGGVSKPVDSTERLMLQKYWDNLKDFYNGRQENGIAVVDVSGSMSGTPMEAAVSMGAYIAEKSRGPFANHFITFSGNPHLVKFEGVDITDKLNRCVEADWTMNTNLEGVFDLLLNTALKSKAAAEDMPERLYIFSDMQFDQCVTSGPSNTEHYVYGNTSLNKAGIDTLLDTIAKKWSKYGFKLPSVIFWNLNAWGKNNIPAIGPGFSYVSGFSPIMIEYILSGKDGIDLMLDKLNSERYAPIH